MPKKDNQKEQGYTLIERLFADRHFSVMISLLIAIALWMIVVTLKPNTEWVISNIKVDWGYNTAGYSYRGLDILEPPEVTVKLKVSGDGAVVSKLSASDFIVYPDYSAVTKSGKYQLKLDAKRSSSAFSNVNIIEILPKDTVEVTFDDVITKKIPIEANLKDLKMPPEYFPDEPVVSPQEIVLRGPKSEVESISHVVATPTLTQQAYTQSFLANATPEYFNSQGQKIDSTHIKSDIEQVEVRVNIYKIKEVPLKIDYTGLPKGYDTSVLKPVLSTDKIRVAGNQKQIDQLTHINAGFVDMTKFELGVVQTLNIELPEGLLNVDNIQSINVNFMTKDFDTKVVAVDDIRIANVPAGMKVTATTKVIHEVKLVGKKSELEEFNIQGLVAQVDASSIQTKAGQVKLPVTIIVPNGGSIFAVGTYSALCIGENVE